MPQVELLLDVGVEVCNMRSLLLSPEPRSSSVPPTLRAAPRSVLSPQLEAAPLPGLGRSRWALHGVLANDQVLGEVSDGSRGS